MEHVPGGVEPGTPASGVRRTASAQRTHQKQMLRQASKSCPKESCLRDTRTARGLPAWGLNWSRTGAGRRGLMGTGRGWCTRSRAVLAESLNRVLLGVTVAPVLWPRLPTLHTHRYKIIKVANVF